MNGNLSGFAIEKAIAAVLHAAGIEFSEQICVGQSIYDTTIKADFVARNITDFPEGVIIESKWQDAAGTVDEKIPYLVANIRECYPLPTIVIAAGGGIRPGALRWLLGQVDGKLAAVYNFEEFCSWVFRVPKRPR